MTLSLYKKGVSAFNNINNSLHLTRFKWYIACSAKLDFCTDCGVVFGGKYAFFFQSRWSYRKVWHSGNLLSVRFCGFQDTLRSILFWNRNVPGSTTVFFWLDKSNNWGFPKKMGITRTILYKFPILNYHYYYYTQPYSSKSDLMTEFMSD